jgi:hypothetical protein
MVKTNHMVNKNNLKTMAILEVILGITIIIMCGLLIGLFL